MQSVYRKQFVYSLVLVILIPVLFTANLVWYTYNFNQTLNRELQRKALMLANVIGATISDNTLSDQTALNIKLQALTDKELLIREVTIYRFSNEQLVAAVSTDNTKRLQILSDPASNLAWKGGQSVASMTTYGSDNERVWEVLSPIKDANGNKVALLSTVMSVSDIDRLATTSYRQSFIALIASILVILVLLMNHFHFIGYAKLFATLKEVTKMKDRFIQRATGNLQLPIITIKNYAGMLSKGYQDKLDQKGKEYLAGIDSQATSLITSVKDMLDLSRVEHGEIPLNYQNVNPVKVCQEAYLQLKPAGTSKGVQIVHNIPRDQIYIAADLQRFQQIIFNLLSLIIQDMPRGTIIINHQPANQDHWVINFKSDSFSALQKLSVETRRGNYDINLNEPGAPPDLGITFWVAGQMINQMGGRIETEPLPPAGMVFRLIFPIHDTLDNPSSADYVMPMESIPNV